MNCAIYLRKSRADQDAEARGEGETLARHERTLIELAKRLKLNVTEIYREIVSGETIAARPVMQKLLSEVEQGQWSGVLVVDIDRLSRGNTIDQGIVAQVFKNSETKIITPSKTYDPTNEYDEEFFEFSLFMSRREYKMINRRLQAGRAASAKEGKFVAAHAPYGYKRKKLENEKGNSLEIVPEKAEIVRLIFDLYVNGEPCEDGTHKQMSAWTIARKLNAMGVPSVRQGYWHKFTVYGILKNPTYKGVVRWGSGKNRYESKIVAAGRHEAIIDKELFAAAENRLSKNPPVPVGSKKPLRNPLAGLIKCGKCGRTMSLTNSNNRQKTHYLKCNTTTCDNISTYFHLVESALLQALRKWLDEQQIETNSAKPQSGSAKIEKSIARIEADIKKLSAQLEKVHTAFEQEIYTSAQFLERSRNISERMDAAKNELSNQMATLETEKRRENGYSSVIPAAVSLMSVYDAIETAEEKNRMLKLVLEKVVYTKETSAVYRGVSATDFELVIYPLISR